MRCQRCDSRTHGTLAHESAIKSERERGGSGFDIWSDLHERLWLEQAKSFYGLDFGTFAAPAPIRQIGRVTDAVYHHLRQQLALAIEISTSPDIYQQISDRMAQGKAPSVELVIR